MNASLEFEHLHIFNAIELQKMRKDENINVK